MQIPCPRTIVGFSCQLKGQEERFLQVLSNICATQNRRFATVRLRELAGAIGPELASADWQRKREILRTRAADRHRHRGYQDHFARNPEHPRLRFGFHRDHISTTINDLDTSFRLWKTCAANCEHQERLPGLLLGVCSKTAPKCALPRADCCNIVTGVNTLPRAKMTDENRSMRGVAF